MRCIVLIGEKCIKFQPEEDFLEDLGVDVRIISKLRCSIFWDIISCSLLKINLRFGGTLRLYLQGRRISQARNQRESRWQAEFFDPEDGGDIFLRNIS
jgi:hypothetical protein